MNNNNKESKIIDVVDADEVHLCLFGPVGEHKSISENSFTMNKNNKAVAPTGTDHGVSIKVSTSTGENYELALSHSINPEKLVGLLRHDLVNTGESLNYEADTHAANQAYCDYLYSQGRIHRPPNPE